MNKDRTLDECRSEGVEIWYRAQGEEVGDRPFVSEGSPQLHLNFCRSAASHIVALRDIAKKESSLAYMICEDDILFHVDYSEMIVDYCRHVPDDCDILWVGYSDPLFTQPQEVNDYVLKGDFWCVHCYMITPAGARKALNLLPVDGQIDWWLAKLTMQGLLTGYAFNYWNTALAKSEICAYSPRGLAYQELLPRA